MKDKIIELAMKSSGQFNLEITERVVADFRHLAPNVEFRISVVVFTNEHASDRVWTAWSIFENSIAYRTKGMQYIALHNF